MKTIYLIAFLLILGLVSVGITAEKPAAVKIFKAHLSGSEVVPQVNTGATGDATFELSKDGKELHYKIVASDIEGITAAHIHKGRKGENGPPLALILIEKKGAKASETIAKGVIDDKALMGSLAGKSVRDLMTEVQSGNTYVNVHTGKYPDGEIRGQIK